LRKRCRGTDPHKSLALIGSASGESVEKASENSARGAFDKET
jgi:hypothetical protein